MGDWLIMALPWDRILRSLYALITEDFKHVSKNRCLQRYALFTGLGGGGGCKVGFVLTDTCSS